MDRSNITQGDLVFEKQTPDDLRSAYEILASRTDELIKKKTGQYVSPYPPIEEYALRTDLGQNWLVRSKKHAGKQIMGIVSLIPRGGANDWDQVTFPAAYFWISSLFVSPDWKNQNLGQAILEKVKIKASSDSISSIWLDCYLDSGFLEAYYRRNGFRTIASQKFTYGDRSFDAALMCWNRPERPRREDKG